MMDRRFVFLPLLALAGTSLSGCVAVAIPALAGSAMVGTRVDGTEARPSPAPAVAATAVATPAPTMAAPIPSPVAPAATPTAPDILAAPVTVQAPAQPLRPPAATLGAASTPNGSTIAPANPVRPEQLGFARFVRYGSAIAESGASGRAQLSAMLKDPIAINGERRLCAAGDKPVALIDLDPKGSVFSPPTRPAKQPGLALGLAVLREAGVAIAWLSDLTVNESGPLRSALEQSGLDPRGEDILPLRRDGDDRKQLRMDNLAASACIIAIADDERPDFDERYKYLRNAEAGAELEPVIGNGWFLIDPVFTDEGPQGQ